jgi:lysophospholipase L1-like esterase
MAWGYGVAQYATVREIVTVGIGGSAVKVRISNVFGNHPLVIGTATIAVAGTGPAVQPGTLRALRFAGHAGATVPPGHYVYTDPVVIRVGDMERLAVSLYVTRPDLVSVHPCCTTMSPVSYFTPNNGGNLTSSQSGAGLSLESPFPRWVDAVDVLRTSGPGSIVVVGDSITDGYNATVNWTTVLQRRIDTLPPPLQRAVINEGITANALTSDVPTDSQKGGGPSGLARLGGDALSQPGASEIVLFLGTNDLWFGDTAAQLINGYREAKWIRNSHEFDGVLDLAQAVADTYNGACNPNVMLPAYDSGDHLHPNAAGQTAMANAVNPATLGLPPLPRVPPLVDATPTPHCHAALAAS